MTPNELGALYLAVVIAVALGLALVWDADHCANCRCDRTRKE